MTGMHSDTPEDITRKLGLDAAQTRRPRRWRLVAGLAGLALLAGLLWRLGMDDADPQYRTQAATRGDLTTLVTATGNLEPTNQVDVGVEVSGTVASVEVDDNDPVQVGQVLARLDTSRLEAQVRKSEAALQSARARVAQMQATQTETGNNLSRLQRMHKNTGGKIPSEQDLDTAQASFTRAQTEVASARAAVAEAEATLKLNQTDLDKAVIRSPIDGIVLTRTVEPGQTLAASFQAPVLFTLAEDLTRMELRVDVDEADVGRVQAGQAASFTVDAYPERRFEAHVQQLSFGAQEIDGVVTYEAVLRVDNREQLLRPGMTATADITVAEVRDAVLIPNAALRFTPPQTALDAQAGEGGSVVGRLLPRPPRTNQRPRTAENTDKSQQRVWVLRDGQPQEIPIKVGATDGRNTQILSGTVEPGMELLVDTVEPDGAP
ncbi:MAG TPA: efflux RND transporter periplasmic adaptor subunit [Gammaproteobacteria bacterium]